MSSDEWYTPRTVMSLFSIYQVRDLIVTVQYYPYVAIRSLIPMAHFGKFRQWQNPLPNGLDSPASSSAVVFCNVLKYIAQTELGFGAPGYSAHDLMRRAISSSEMTRPASTSANPRKIIR